MTDRSRSLLLGMFGALLWAASPAAAAMESLDGPLRARVVEVIDGDSLRVIVHVWLGQHIETIVRIRGIDTPERQGKCAGERIAAVEAAAELARLVGRGPVVLSRIAGDKYFGRVLADVALESGEALAPAMLQSGLARAYAGGARGYWCDPDKAGPGKTVLGNVR